MCGIFGTLVPGRSESEAARMKAAAARLKHRGPDATRLWSDANVRLGHHRLALRDAAGGFQPFESDCGRWVTMVAGEIFNEKELRLELEAGGARFRGRSDCEAAARLFEIAGAAALYRLVGQFAGAAWDRKEKELHLFRDRYGISPLFFAREKRRVVFASEARAVSDLLGRPCEVDWRGVGQALYFWATLPPRTAYAGIEELPPGYVLTVSPGEPARIRRYADTEQDCRRPHSKETPAVRIAEALARSVRESAVSDAAVGVYASGGLDSSAVLALASRVSSPDGPGLPSFALSFGDANLDDRDAQMAAAAHAGSRLTRIPYDPKNLPEIFRSAVRFIEKPLARTGFLAFYVLAREVRSRGVRAVLAGEGADEIFLGYDLFRELQIRLQWARHPRSRAIPLGLSSLHAEAASETGRASVLWQEYFRIPKGEEKHLFISHLPRWRSAARTWRLFHPDLRKIWDEDAMRAELAAALPKAYRAWDPYRRAQFLEINLFMRDYLLGSQGDRMAMAHGLEVRYPFLDPRLEAAAGEIPSAVKLRGPKSKGLLRQALKKTLPANLLAKDKKPFRAPRLADLWRSKDMRAARAREWLKSHLDADAVRRHPWVDAGEVARLRTRLNAAQSASEGDEAALCVLVTAMGWIDGF